MFFISVLFMFQYAEMSDNKMYCELFFALYINDYITEITVMVTVFHTSCTIVTEYQEIRKKIKISSSSKCLYKTAFVGQKGTEACVHIFVFIPCLWPLVRFF
jgi:hypothetical protein